MQSRAGLGIPLLLAVLSLFAMVPMAAQAKERLPDARDGIRTDYVTVGPLNLGAKLPGVAQKWHARCKKGDLAICLKLASAFENGLGDLRADTQVATGYLTLACRLGSGKSCSKATEYLNEGWGGPSYPSHGFELASHGCVTLRHADSCGYRGLALWTGGGAPQDRAAARALWDSNCNSDAGESCRFLAGRLHYEGSGEAEFARAADLYNAGCERKAAWGCYGLALAFMKGRGRPRDDARAFELTRRGCFDSTGDTMHPCGLWAEYIVERGPGPESEKAGKTLNMACTGGRATSCSMAALAGANGGWDTKVTRKEAAFYARRGCELGLGTACVQLINFYATGANSALKPNTIFQFALARRACKLGHAQTCELLEQHELPSDFAQVNAIDFAWPVARQLEEARKAIENGNAEYGIRRVARLMEEGDTEASWRLGNLYLTGFPGVLEKSERNAMILIENAARTGHVEAAEFMGMAYWYGENVKVDRELAKGYMRVAIGGGSEMAEAIYRSMLKEPVRQAQREAARRAAERARAQEGRFDLGRAIASWKPNIGNYMSTVDTSASWARYQARADQTAWNNAMSYASGRSSVCPSFNKYC